MHGPLHIIVPWHSEYDEGTIKQHDSLARKLGFAWWGKFSVQFKGQQIELIDPDEFSLLWDTDGEIFELNRGISKGESSHIYLLNLLPRVQGKVTAPSVHIAPLLEVVANPVIKDDVPDPELYRPPNDDEYDSCAYIPEYYFHHKPVLEKCIKLGWSGCNLKYGAQDWFRIGPIEKLKGGVEKLESNLHYVMNPRQFRLDKTNPFPVLVRESVPETVYTTAPTKKEALPLSNRPPEKKMTGRLEHHKLGDDTKQFLTRLSGNPYIDSIKHHRSSGGTKEPKVKTTRKGHLVFHLTNNGGIWLAETLGSHRGHAHWLLDQPGMARLLSGFMIFRE